MKKTVKIEFSESEKNTLIAVAKAHGMKLNAYIKQCVLVQRHFELIKIEHQQTQNMQFS